MPQALGKSFECSSANLNLDLHNYARLILFTAHCLLRVLLFFNKSSHFLGMKQFKLIG